METRNQGDLYMMNYGAKDLARSFRTVRANTAKIANDIPENKYTFTPADGTQTVGQLLAHIAMAYRLFQAMHMQKDASKPVDFQKLFTELDAETKKSRSKNDILELLNTEGERCAKWLATLSDEFLAEHVNMPNGDPPSKSRLEMLMSIKEHEMHHRGQLMLIERILGIVPHLTRQREAARN